MWHKLHTVPEAILTWEDRCELNLPHVNWRVPEEKRCGDKTVLVCRFCLLLDGFEADWIEEYPATKDEFVEHMHAVHGKVADVDVALYRN
jgi:hypothetical protein